MSSRARSQYRTQLELLFEQVYEEIDEGLEDVGLSDLRFFWDEEDGLRVRTGIGNFGGEILFDHPILEYLPNEFLSEINSFLRNNPGIEEIVYKTDSLIAKLDEDRDPIKLDPGSDL